MSANDINDRYRIDHEIDRSLMASIVAGNKRALGELYDRHIQRLLGTAIAVLGNKNDAEDLVHDLFMQLWQNARSYDPQKSTPSYWLQLRLRSRAIDRLRSLAVKKKYQQSEYHRISNNQAALSPELDKLISIESLVMLSASQREVTQMMYWEGYTCQELATVLNVPIGTIKSRLASSLRILRRELMPAVQGNTSTDY